MEVLQEQLTYIFNVSLSSNVFPKKWKVANVVVLHGGDRCDVNNYRPISLIPIPGKLLEKIVHDCLYRYLEEHKILTDKQWGFRPNRSTTIATASLLENVLNNLNIKKTL